MQVNLSYKNILKIAYPIILSSLAQNIINLTDTIYLGRLNETIFAAAAIASIYYAVIILVGLGFANGVKILIGRRNGEKHFAEIGVLFEQSIYFLIFLSGILLIFLQTCTPFILSYIIHSDGVRNACTVYLQYRSWGIPFVMIAMGFRGFYIGIASAKALAQSTALMALANALFNYILIFGHCGIAPMGMKGAAIGSAIAECMGMLYLISYSYFEKENKVFELFKYRGINFPLLKKNTETFFTYYVTASFIDKFMVNLFLINRKNGRTFFSCFKYYKKHVYVTNASGLGIQYGSKYHY